MNNPEAIILEHPAVRMVCGKCGAEAGCNCGVAPIDRAAYALLKNPEKSDRAIAEEAGVSHHTVAKARQSTGHARPVGKRTGRDGKTRRMPYGFTKTAVRLGMISKDHSGQSLQRLKDRFLAICPGLDIHDPANEAKVITGLEALKASKANQAQEEQQKQATVFAMSETLRGTYEQQYAEKYAALQSSFSAIVEAEVMRRLPTAEREHIERLRASADSANDLQRIWHHRAEVCVNACKLFIQSWRSLAGILHPDRVPENKREQYAAAFDVVQRTREALEQTDLVKW